MPYSSLESVIKHSKEAYYLALRQAQATIRESTQLGAVAALLFASLDQQKRRLAAKVEREKLIVAALPTLSIQIVDQARQHGRITMGEMMRLTGVSGISLSMEPARAPGTFSPSRSDLSAAMLTRKEESCRPTISYN